MLLTCFADEKRCSLGGEGETRSSSPGSQHAEQFSTTISPPRKISEICNMTDDNKKYYITQSNLRKLVFRAGLVEHNLSKLYERIYDQQDLKDYFSIAEAQHLHSLALFLQQSEDYLIELTTKTNQSGKKSHDSSFVFVSGPPKFHKDGTCETLTKDFNNFEIPEEIKARGQASVADFREFASKNRRLLGEGKEDVFLNRLQRQFHLSSSIGKVSFVNSGRSLLPGHDVNYTLEQFAVEIKKAVHQIEAIRKTEEGARAFASHIYAPPTRLLKTSALDPIARQVLEHKRDLIELVTAYVTKKHTGGDRIFSGHLLSAYGFQPCGMCCQDEIGFDLS